MAQINTRTVSFSSMVGAAAFRQGVEDFQSGLPFRAEYERMSGKSAWHYERGRLYAATCAGLGRTPLANRIGRHVNRGAIRDFADHYRQGSIL